MKVAILAAGTFPRTEYTKYLLTGADRIVCCDSALVTAEKHGILPDAVVGDFDSVCKRALKRFKGTVVHNPDQETNDLTKAFEFVMEVYPEVSGITILGATGKSEAHTIGNISLLSEYERRFSLATKGINVEIVSDYSTIFLITDSCELQVGKGRKVSIIANDPELRIKSAGLVWPTDEVVFDAWWKGTLNRADNDVVNLKLSHPASVIIILD